MAAIIGGLSLAPGSRLGPYEIVARLGAGGMGEVYRARDARLGRDVALKVLPAHLAGDAEALARFEREARSVAALNHPNILAIFDFGRAGPTTYAATELLEGRTLRDELEAAPPALRRALEIARQIAAGLAAAHDKGIAHRDLKPENVFVTRDGSVKILDFGLARGLPNAADRANSGTALDLKTGEGTVLGTVGYMAPEQVRGRQADHRADIFAFGAVLYEIAGGRRAFRAETAAEVLTAILREDPPELSRTGTGVTPPLDRLIRRCLEKDPEHRFQSARDLGYALDAIAAGSDATSFAGAPADRDRARRFPVWPAAGALATFLLGVVVSGWWRSPAPPAMPPLATFTLDAGFIFVPSVQVSPDGRLVAYTAPARETADASGVTTVLQRLDSSESVVLSTLADTPRTWSPDSRALLVSNGSTISVIDVETRQRTGIGQAPSLIRGAAWIDESSALIATAAGIVRLTRGVAEPAMVVPLDPVREAWIGWPSWLPNGRFLYTVQVKDATGGPELRIASLNAPGPGTVVTGLSGATGVTFLPPDGILFIKSQVIYAQAFDPNRGVVSGSPVVVARNAFEATVTGLGAMSASAAGVIAYRSEKFRMQSFSWVDRTGRTISEFPKQDIYTNFDLSPDGERVAVTVRRPAAVPNLMWLLDLTRGVATDITHSPEQHSDATWSPNGERLAFRHGNQVVTRSANGGALTVVADRLGYPEAWSADGRYLIMGVPGALNEGYDLELIDLTGREKPVTIVSGNSGLDEPRFSPGGKWVTYNDVEPGRRVQVYAMPFPPTGQRYQLSTTGGTQGRWRRDGRELYYLGTDGMLMVVPVPEGDIRRAQPPVPLFRAGLETSATFDQFAPSADGQRFLVRRPPEGGGDRAPVNIIVNFDLRRALAAGGERR